MGRPVGRGGQLRSRLLVGVAATALAAPMVHAAHAQAPVAAKWSPYVEAGGMGGNTHSWGDVDIFLPLWQDQTSLLFGDLRGTFSTEPSQEGNFGLGYRTQISPEWILGGYGYFDIQNSPNDNLFYQVTLGLELKSVDWDFRLNGYIPINPDGGSVQKNGNAKIKITGNNIQMTTESRDEKALYGFDGEVGWRVPILPADGNVDVRLYAGGYYFTNSDVDTVAGPRGRIEVRLYDIDFLGVQSRLTAQGVVQWDSPRGVQGFGGLELRIPLGAVTGSLAPKLSPLDRRMVDRVQRDVDIVSEESDPKKSSEDVIVDELTVSTHTIVFANSGGAGNTNGTKGNPVELNNAPTTGGVLGSNAIIVADGGAGTIGVTNPLQLSAGQALIGGGSVVALTGVHSGKTVDFLFPGSRPTLSGSISTANLIQMAPGTQNEIFGLDMTGAMEGAVFGLNMERAIVKNNLVDPPDGSGILFVQRSTTNYGGPQISSFVHAESNTVLGAGEDGIAVGNLISDGLAHTQTVIIDRNTVTSSGRNGIEIYQVASGAGSTLSQVVSIRYNVVSGGENIVTVLAAPALTDIQAAAIVGGFGNGIVLGNAAYSGSTISQSALIAGNTVIDQPTDGINVRNQVGSNGAIDQALTIVANSIALASSTGIDIYSHASGLGAALSQSVVIESNTVASTGTEFPSDVTGKAVAVFVGTKLDDGAVATQGVTIAGNQVSHVGAGGYAYGIRVFNAIYRASARTTLLIADNLVSGVSAFNIASGIDIGNYLTGASVSQAVAITSNTVTDISAVLSPAVSTTPLIGRVAFGIVTGNLAYYGTALTQALTVAGNQIDGVSGFLSAIGIAVGSTVDVNAAALTQSAAFLDNSVTRVDSDLTAVGIFVANQILGDGSIHGQSLTVAGNFVSLVSGGIGAAGIAVFNLITAPATYVGQDLSITGNTVSGIVGTGAGIAVSNQAYQAVVSQTLDISGNSVSNVSYSALSGAGGRGILLANNATSATIVQDLPINGNTLTDVGDAITLNNFVRYGTISQFGAVAGNLATGNRGIGLSLYNLASGAGTVEFISLSITNNNFSLDDVGVDSIATAAGGAIVDLHASLNGNIIDNNTTDGIFVFASGAGATETFSLGAGDNVNFNTQFGVHLITAGGGTVFFTTDGATITGNSAGNFHTGP